MARIYLVQHAASKGEAEDPERSLTDEGRRVVGRVADYLMGLGIPIDRIEHSEKLRTRQTAEILAAKVKPLHGTEQVSGMAPNDEVSPMRLRLQSEEENIMIVGHLPYLSRLLSSLLLVDENRPLVEFRMAGVICMERAENGEFKILWALTPDLLDAITGWTQAA